VIGKKRAPTERGYQKCAFEIYYALGERRSYAAVAEKLGMSTSTIKQWARKFGWRKRLDHRNSWQTDDEPERTDDAQSEQAERAIRFLNAALARMITHLAEGNLRVSPQDLLSLHRLEEQISERVNRYSDGREKARQRCALLPDNKRGGPDKRVIPESQLDEYLDYLKYRI